jgi:GTPase SAR1 family protein
LEFVSSLVDLNSIVVVLAGNKCDLGKEREVSVEEGLKFAETHKMIFRETSAYTKEGIDWIINRIVKELNKF